MRRLALVCLLVGVPLALAATAPAGAAIKTVYAGQPPGPKLAKQLDFDAFFRRTITVHQGDSVQWQFEGFHNVIFPAKGQRPPAFVDVAADNPIAGQTDAAGAPFWFNGQPNLVTTPVGAFPQGGKREDGSALNGSGIPQGDHPKPYRLKFPRTGTFRYYCIIHPGMTGSVRVVSKRAPVPSANADRAATAAQRAAAIKLASVQARKKPPADTVYGGNDAGPVAWLRFFPASLSVKTGTTVHFIIRSRPEAHTLTLGPGAYTADIEKNFIQMMPAATGPPTILLNPLGAYPSDPPPTLPPYDGTNHGNGFENTGILDTDRSSPQPSSANITFTNPGTYHYECVLHAGMDGVIRVT
jgi:plastocyanin